MQLLRKNDFMKNGSSENVIILCSPLFIVSRRNIEQCVALYNIYYNIQWL